jgi:hypothetical protein
MKVSSNNLVNICRLLFSISRNSDNDTFFMENDLLGSIFLSEYPMKMYQILFLIISMII